MFETHYEINEGNILAHEIIGQNVKVERNNGSIVKGKIVDETKNTLTVETVKGEKIMPKNEVSLEFSFSRKKTVFPGKLFAEKPENRTKNFWRKAHGRK